MVFILKNRIYWIDCPYNGKKCLGQQHESIKFSSSYGIWCYWNTDYFISQNIAIFVGLNALTLLTVGTLGISGLGLLYGIAAFGIL